MIGAGTQTSSISLYAHTEMYLCTPRESGWDPAYELGTTHMPKSLIERDSRVVLRNEDVVQVQNIFLEFQRDRIRAVGEMGHMQAESPVRTEVIIDTKAEKQRVIGEITMDSPPDLSQSLPTLDMQSDQSIKLKTTMEIPATSGHEESVVNANPVSSCTAGNVSLDNNGSRVNRELFVNSRNVANSADKRASSSDGSAAQTSPVKKKESPTNSVLTGPIGPISDINHETREELSIRQNQIEEEFPMSTVTRVGKSLQQAPLKPRKRMSDLPLSSPKSVPHNNENKSQEVSDGLSVPSPSGLKLSDPHQVPEPSSKSAKRKLVNEDKDVGTTKTTSQIGNSTNRPVTTYETPNKRQKTDLGTVSSSSRLASVKSSTESGMKIMFARSSSVHRSPKQVDFLTSKGVKKVKSVKDCDFLCLGTNYLQMTGDLVLAVLYGKEIIIDEWVQHSCTREKLQDIKKYFPSDHRTEAEWKINLRQAIQRGRKNVKPLLGQIFCFTDDIKLKLGAKYNELKEIALQAGAKAVFGNFNDLKLAINHPDEAIYIAYDEDRKLEELENEGYVCYYKKLIPLCALRGSLETHAEFMIRQGTLDEDEGEDD